MNIKYDYFMAIKNDVLTYLDENYTTEELKELIQDKDEFYNRLHDTLWIEDSVTGNASGSYTFSTWKAEENICHNLDLLKDALEEFGGDCGDALVRGAEFCDVTIRCYLLGSVLYVVLNELERGSN